MKLRDLFLAILMCLTWSSDFIVTKKALEHFDPIFFSSLRFVLVGIMLAPFLKDFPRKHIKILFIISFPLVVLTYAFIDVAIELNDSVATVNIIAEFKIITCLLAAFIFLKEKISYTQIIGICVAFIGVSIVILGNSFAQPLEVIENISSSQLKTHFNKNNTLSVIFVLISTLAYPVYLIMSKKIEHEIDKKQIVAWTAIFGGIMGIIVSLFFENNQLSSLQGAGIKNYFFLFYAAFGGVLIPHLILHHLIKHYDVLKISIFSLFIPVFTALNAAFFLKEQITFVMIIGGVVLIIGSYIADILGRKNIVSDSGVN